MDPTVDKSASPRPRTPPSNPDHIHSAAFPKMPALKLITLEFTRGGPLDGQHLLSDWPPQAWYRVASGYYCLTRYHEAPHHDARIGTAFYTREPADIAPRLRSIS